MGPPLNTQLSLSDAILKRTWTLLKFKLATQFGQGLTGQGLNTILPDVHSPQ